MKTILIYLLFVTLAWANVVAQENMPSVTLKTMEGKTVNSQDVCEENKLTVVSFWATWCVPCINELDAINDVYDDMKDEVDFELLAVSIDDARTVKSVKPLVNGKNWDFDVLLDTNNDLKRKLGIVTVPATFIIKNGEIVKKISGYKPGGEDELLEILTSL